MNRFLLSALAILAATVIYAREYHVSPKGNDRNPGTPEQPFRTISRAAAEAQPGDVVTVHAGEYRERVNPPRGGISDDRRITYQAAPGELVMIKGSEVIRTWEHISGEVWKVTLPDDFFGDYNPYQDLVTGDWFNPQGRYHHTGEVYLNGQPLYEANLLQEVFRPRPLNPVSDPEGSLLTWFCESDKDFTYLYANFRGANPNRELVEILVRPACFYPDSTGCDYITVRGFHMSQAATQWAAPTAEQPGLIGTNWSKGWIIEDNIVSHSKCSGITLGKDRKSGHNVWSNDRSIDGATHYNMVIERVLEAGWSKEKIGSHIVRNNEISHCEQTGICGSLGGIFSTISGNYIHDIWTRRQFAGAEIAGIKIHAAIDMVIEGNRICNAGRGIWLDWMAQGTRVTRNLLYNNTTDDLFSEVNHGPYLVDNNILLSEFGIRDWSEGGAYVHNLIAGTVELVPQSRTTPYHRPHSTILVKLKSIEGGDNRFHNNIFTAGGTDIPGRNKNPFNVRGKHGLAIYDDAKLPVEAAGNVYLQGAEKYGKETVFITLPDHHPGLRIEEDGDKVYLHLNIERSVRALKTSLITTELLGMARVPSQKFEDSDGSSLRIDTDFRGDRRSAKNPSPGPLELKTWGTFRVLVW